MMTRISQKEGTLREEGASAVKSSCPPPRAYLTKVFFGSYSDCGRRVFQGGIGIRGSSHVKRREERKKNGDGWL